MNIDDQTATGSADEESTTDTTPENTADETGSIEPDETDQTTESEPTRNRVDPYLKTEAIAVEFVPAESTRHRIQFVERDDGPDWWRIDEIWTGHRWRPVGREPVSDVDITEITE